MLFSKMHGLGNDFMVVDAITQNVVSFSSEIICRLSDRHYGVGFDQLLLVESSSDPAVDFNYRIFNSNGKEVDQCGNGARCFARFVHMKKLTNKLSICVSTSSRRMIISIINDDEICVDMGEPDFDPINVPFYSQELRDFYLISVGNQEILCGVVSVGNPHCILRVQDIRNVQVEVLGSALESHDFFPDRTNVSFMEIIDYKHIRLRVYERGVGETESCGSAACAAVAVGIKQGLLDKFVRVDLMGGTLMITWKGIGYPLYMYGSATHVYDGCIYL